MSGTPRQSESRGRVLNIASGGAAEWPQGLGTERRELGGLLLWLWPLLLVATWPLFGYFTGVVALAGLAAGVAMRGWHRRHPTRLPMRQAHPSAPRLQINIAEVQVSGDVAGLIFAVGSVAIVLIGLPTVRVFVLAAAVCAAALAWARFACQQSHAAAPRVANTILAR